MAAHEKDKTALSRKVGPATTVDRQSTQAVARREDLIEILEVQAPLARVRYPFVPGSENFFN